MLEIADRNKSDIKILAACRSKSRAVTEYLLDLVNDILTLNKIDNDNAHESDIKSVFSLEEEVRNLIYAGRRTGENEWNKVRAASP